MLLSVTTCNIILKSKYYEYCFYYTSNVRSSHTSVRKLKIVHTILLLELYLSLVFKSNIAVWSNTSLVCVCSWSEVFPFELQLFSFVLRDHIWLLFSNIEGWWRGIWRPRIPSPRGAFCFYNSIPGNVVHITLNWNKIFYGLTKITEFFRSTSWAWFSTICSFPGF